MGQFLLIIGVRVEVGVGAEIKKKWQVEVANFLLLLVTSVAKILELEIGR